MKTRTPRFFSLCTLAVSFVLCWLPLYAQEDITFQKPPQEILQLVEAEPPPQVMIDPHGRYLAILKVSPFRNLAELAEPELRLAGIRINPRNHDASRSRYYLGIAIQEIQSGKKIAVTGLPENLRLEYPRFSSRSSYFSFVSVGPKGMELWVVELSSGRARKLTPPLVSAVMGFPYFWTPDDQAIYCRMRKTSQPPPDALELPTGPMVQEATGSRAPAPTFQDLLRSKGDEQRFDFYATHVLARFSLDGSSQMILPEGIYTQLVLSPNGEYLLVRQTHSPYSYQLPYYRFPYRVAIHDRSGKRVVEVCDKPLQDKIPISRDAVEDGKRGFAWRDDLPCTLAWVEAQDGGDPEKAASPRDILFQVGPPFTAKPQPLGGFEGRLYRVTWGDGKAAVAEDSWWKTRRVKTYLLNPAAPTSQPKVIFDYSREDLYHLPGDFATAPNPWTRQTLRFGKDRSTLYLMGEGYSPEGSRPFIDEYSLKTGKTRRLWRADGLRTYEEPVHLLDLAKKTILTRIESAKTPPNYYLRRLGSKSAPKPLTNFPNPYLSFEKVAKKKIHYKREDGVDLFGTLHLPTGYDPKKDGRLPMLMEAYPIEYKDKQAAGMVNDSPHQFVSMYWGSPVFWAVRGYAVLENAQFPIVGQGKEEPNDTYIEQLVANAKAAIKAVDEMGVVDPKRVAVMGHSYGAFMTANLLAHSDLFAAGIARSGAYNRSLTPFGFQAEDRLYWQAQSTYQRMSPFNYADKLKTPILLIHGDADNNSGTFTLQSERLFAALKGLGGKARLVLLPYESHGYASRENILHMLWEMDAWLERWVKPKK